jgi:hypothetical protein
LPTPSCRTAVKGFGDYNALGGLVRLNPSTLRRDNGVNHLESYLEQQEMPAIKAEKHHRDGYQEAAITSVCRAHASAQGRARSSGGSVWEATTRNGHREDDDRYKVIASYANAKRSEF